MTPAPVIATAEDPESVGSLEHELKYIVPATVTGALLAWLPAACLRDVVYPPAAVHTVYYDTPGLALLGEKMDSDYLKTKVRVRWYADLRGTPGGVVFAELKGRIGNRRVKSRVASQSTEPPPWAGRSTTVRGPHGCALWPNRVAACRRRSHPCCRFATCATASSTRGRRLVSRSMRRLQSIA